MRTILFDFDGTLADTKEGIVKGYRYAFSQKGIDIPENVIVKQIGPPLRETVVNLAPKGTGDEEITELCKLYREYFSTEGLFQLHFYDGILDMLSELKDAGAHVCIMSSKPTVFIERILERYGLTDLFESVNGVSLELNNDPKKKRMLDHIESCGLNKDECMMVGDRSEDMVSAEYCGVGFTGVLFGYGSKDEFGNGFTVSTVKELRDHLMDWIA